MPATIPAVARNHSHAVALAHRAAFLRKHAARNLAARGWDAFSRGCRLTLRADACERAVVAWALAA